MHRHLFALLLIAVASGPAMAKVLAEGEPTAGGFYWQKVEYSNGQIRYLCRKQGVGQIQKSAACNDAKAVKP